ncbi:DNA-binding protein (plasmid) [Microbulbifer sp. TRSA002]|uniref:DNA-binding protein n=1 Tax=Microbulbifer sp. TRSA002 TaxID=3243382 RepID=UPI00403A44F6
MSVFKISEAILELSPEERVVAAGLALLKHHRKMPTQDKVVEALLPRSDEGTGTGKGTVNKYWPSLQNEIARELTLAEWLPADLPDFVIDHLKKLMDWARQDAEAQLEGHKATLNERQRKLDEEEESRKATEATLRDRVRELEAAARNQNSEISRQRDKQAALEQSLAETQRTTAVQNEQLAHAEEREETLIGKFAELKDQIAGLQKEHDERAEELKIRNKDIVFLENQLQSLQHHHDEQLRLVSTLRNQITELGDQTATYEESLEESQIALETAQKTIQANETKLARFEGQLVVLDSLKSSVGTLKDALHKEQERNVALELEKERLGKEIKMLIDRESKVDK